jgi:predicted nucleic acid-binding protein
MWLVDTNVLSELRRSSPEPRVVAWLAQQPIDTLHTSVIVLAELGHGAALTSDEQRSQALVDWLDLEIRPLFADRVLVADEVVARALLAILEAGRQSRRTFPVADLLIGATAAAHGLSVVTRNRRDFAPMGVALFDPWTDPLT